MQPRDLARSVSAQTNRYRALKYHETGEFDFHVPSALPWRGFNTLHLKHSLPHRRKTRVNATARTLQQLLTKQERKRFIFVVAVAIGLALSEAAGIASIIPFLAVITDPLIIQNNAYLAAIYRDLNFTSEQDFRIATGLFTVAVFALGAIYKIAANYLMTKFVARRRQSISRRLLQSFVQRPYEYFLIHNPADITKSIMSEAEIAVSRFMRPVVDLLASSLVVSALVILIVIINPSAAMAIASALILAYFVIYALLRGSINRSGQSRMAADRARYKSVQEVFGGIKEIKLLGTELNYLRVFEAASEKLTQLDARANVLAFVPRYILETVAIAVLVVIAVWMQPADGTGFFLPSLGAYAIAGFRLLPAVQKLYASAVEIRYGKAAAQAVADQLARLSALHQAPATADQARAIFKLDTAISLSNVSFIYPNSETAVLRNITLQIDAGSVFGLAGDSGAGKSTLVDVILGLLPASSGQICVDGQPLTDSDMKRWQKQIGYVPQAIYLADQSIAANIAFCESVDQIDMDRVIAVAQTAQIHDSIVKMENGYDTCIGDRGIRLSGGQRQRIGIARALYRNPRLLILDEATNAIDTEMEQRVLMSIRDDSPDQTIILITHRLDGLKICDQVAWLKDGKLARLGPYVAAAQ